MNEKLLLLYRFARRYKINFKDYFYVITVYDGHVNLQGNYTSDLSSILCKYKFTSSVQTTGYIQFTKRNIIIDLT